MSLKREINIERPLSSLFAKRYNILRVLYPGDNYTLTKLKDLLENLEDKTIDLGNLSRYITVLADNGLVLKEDGKIKISSEAQEIVYAFVEATRPEDEKPWQPQPEEVKLCIDALKAKSNEKMNAAFLSELGSTLNSGYWDKQLTVFFISALDSPAGHEEEIDRLLRADPRNRENIELFLKNNKDKIYDLVQSSGRNCMLALRIFVDVSDGREALDKMEEDLKGEGAERVLMAAKGYGRKLYEKFNLDFKKFLHKALEQENEIVKHAALNLMNEIQFTRG